jgi:hypothetical protein
MNSNPLKLTVLACAICLSGQPVNSQQTEKADPNVDQIRATILDYVEGYYAGDADRVSRALFPSLAKRAIGKKKDGKLRFIQETADGFIKLTKSGDGPKSYPKEKQRAKIEVYDVYKNIASAKLIAADWMDYIHLAKVDGHWVIVNVLWTSYS